MPAASLDILTPIGPLWDSYNFFGASLSHSYAIGDT